MCSRELAAWERDKVEAVIYANVHARLLFIRKRDRYSRILLEAARKQFPFVRTYTCIHTACAYVRTSGTCGSSVPRAICVIIKRRANT